MADAVVIGAGPNGLVAANLLADAGWEVVVLEAQPDPGGAVRSAQLTLPGFTHDRFSAFYPLGAASPVMRALGLEEHGLRWRRHPIAFSHPARDLPSAYVAAHLDETCAALDADHPGDGEAWRGLYARWERHGPALVTALTDPFPPVRAGARLARGLGPRGLLGFARFSVLPVRRAGQEAFGGSAGRRLLAGNALHADFAPEHPGSALFGWLLAGLAQQVGFPVPEGGASSLSGALVRRLEARGATVRCDTRVDRVLVRGGCAVGVRCGGGAAGEVVPAARAVLADVSAPALYLELLAHEDVPARVRAALTRFQWDAAVAKLDWALRAPIPWEDEPTRRAGAVHVGDDLDRLTSYAASLARDEVPDRPYLVMGQYATADPTRQPAGHETAWAYTHLPRSTGEAERERLVERMEGEVERLAPGFRDLILARHMAMPGDLEAADANLSAGALNGGTAQLHQQLVFRPIPGLGRSETPVRGLYLASSSAHPGGSVHGGPGAIAARTALMARTLRGRTVQRAAGAALGADW